VSEPEKPASGFKPLPNSEREICLRFGHARRSASATQAEIAALLKVSKNQIANIESRRVPLKFWLGERFCAQLGISQTWIATGEPPQRSFLHPDVRVYDPRPREDALFSDVYHRFIAGELSKLGEQSAHLERLRANPPPRFRSEMLNYCRKLEKLAKDAPKFEALAERIRRDLKLPGPKEKWALTDVAVSGKLAPVKSQLKNLLADLNRLTSEPGTKTKLADFLGAPLTSVSRWLSGEREPGGETTLQMLRWVQEQERQQKESSGTPPEPKTQPRKSSYEKPKSNPQKG
jgi:transcriptional regulator with XRE-family HTH domain